MSIYNNSLITKTLEEEVLITSSYFKELLNNPFLTLQGAYISYQLTTKSLLTGTNGPEVDIEFPVSGDLYFNTVSKGEFVFRDSVWETLDIPLLDFIIDLGFSSSWIPVSTFVREDYIEIAIPRNSLPINFESSDNKNLFIGFKNLVDPESKNSNIKACVAIPLGSLEDRAFYRDENVSIKIPIKFICGFIPLVLEESLMELESNNINTYNIPETFTIHNFLNKYNEYTSENKSSLGSGGILGSSLNFN